MSKLARELARKFAVTANTAEGFAYSQVCAQHFEVDIEAALHQARVETAEAVKSKCVYATHTHNCHIRIRTLDLDAIVKELEDKGE